MSTTGLLNGEREPREAEAIEADIARTRASLNRRLIELERRLSPSHRLAEARRSLDPRRLDLRRLDPRPYPEWIAAGSVAVGAVLALAGWRRSRRASDEDVLADLVIFETSCD